MARRGVFLIAALTALIASACSSTGAGEGWTWERHTDEGFSVSRPHGWFVDTADDAYIAEVLDAMGVSGPGPTGSPGLAPKAPANRGVLRWLVDEPGSADRIQVIGLPITTLGPVEAMEAEVGSLEGAGADVTAEQMSFPGGDGWIIEYDLPWLSADIRGVAAGIIGGDHYWVINIVGGAPEREVLRQAAESFEET